MHQTLLLDRCTRPSGDRNVKGENEREYRDRERREKLVEQSRREVKSLRAEVCEKKRKEKKKREGGRGR